MHRNTEHSWRNKRWQQNVTFYCQIVHYIAKKTLLFIQKQTSFFSLSKNVNLKNLTEKADFANCFFASRSIQDKILDIIASQFFWLEKISTAQLPLLSLSHFMVWQKAWEFDYLLSLLILFPSPFWQLFSSNSLKYVSGYVKDTLFKIFCTAFNYKMGNLLFFEILRDWKLL